MARRGDVVEEVQVAELYDEGVARIEVERGCEGTQKESELCDVSSFGG